MQPESTPAPAKRQSPIRITAIIAIALAISFAVWLVVRHRGGSSSSSSPSTTSASVANGARPLLTAATPRTLRAVAAGAGHPVFWAGPRRGVTYELTRTSDGRLYVRYLPRGVRVGNRTGQYLLVGTYPVSNAYAAIRRAARERGATTLRLRGGALGVVNSNAPKNVYFSFPRANYQVEVFDPAPGAAQRLVLGGQIKPIR